jgi:hypothetical protein
MTIICKYYGAPEVALFGGRLMAIGPIQAAELDRLDRQLQSARHFDRDTVSGSYVKRWRKAFRIAAIGQNVPRRQIAGSGGSH